MTTPAKRVEIEAKRCGPYGHIRLSMTAEVGRPNDPLFISSGPRQADAAIYINDAHAAREYAQMLRGAADQLVEYAEAQEKAANAASITSEHTASELEAMRAGGQT